MGITLIVGIVYLYRLDASGMWGDEADTGTFSRTTLSTGLPYAIVDGNAAVTGNCYQVSTGLLSRQLPWLQYYVGAVSIRLCGDTVAGLRSAFALIGALAALPLYGILQSRTRHAAVVTTIALLHPQTMLFARQARYYPLVITLAACLAWLYVAGPRRVAARRGLLGLAACLLFHAHPVAACGLALALVSHAWWFQRRRFPEILGASLLGFFSWCAWYWSLEPASQATLSTWGVLRDSPVTWAALVTKGVVAGCTDLDHVGALPLLAWAALAAFGLMRRRDGLADQRADEHSIAVMFGSAVLASILLNAILIGVEGPPGWAVLRYAPHAVPLAIIVLFLAIQHVLGSSRVSVSVWMVAMLCNLGAVNYWMPPFQRPSQPLSWWPLAYGEFLQDDEHDLAAIDRSLRIHLGSDSTLLILPRWWNDVWIYRMGDSFRLTPDVVAGSECAALVEKSIGPDALRRALAPTHVLAYESDLSTLALPPVAAFPMSRRSADGSRPELTRREFSPHTAAPGRVVLAAFPSSQPSDRITKRP